MERMQENHSSIDLKEYINIFRKRGWILALLTSIAIIVSGVLNFFFIDPVYQAELTFMVNFNQNENAQITKDDMDYGTNLVQTYKPIVKSRKVTRTIKENLNLEMSQSEIGNSIEINSISGPVMSVTVKNTNAKLASDIANEVPEVFGNELKRIAKVDGIEIIDTATIPTNPISPNKIKNIVMAAIIAIVISIFIMLLLEVLDNKIKTEEDIERYLEMTVLGSVSEFEVNNKSRKKFKKKSA